MGLAHQADKKMTRIEAEVINAMAEHSLRISAAARSLYLHPNTVRYHLEKIKRKFYFDPFTFFGLQELLPKAIDVLEGKDVFWS